MNAVDSPYAQQGTILLDKYRVEGILGTGGMGIVVSATHLQLEERVAIKFLTMSGGQDALSTHDPDAIERFLREGKSAAKIRSEHSVRVLDVGTLKDGSPCMVMEHLAGRDLKDIVRGNGPLSVHEAITFVLQAGEALAEAHRLGIVHRDLKPANLFLTHRVDGSPCVKILDFGISKQATEAGDHSITSTQTVLGSPVYMSPEQLRSTRSADARADIWGLAMVLYELLAGAPAFVGASMSELCVQILTDNPAPVSSKRGDVSSGLDAVIAKALAKNRDQRYPSMAEFAHALAPFGPEAALNSSKRISAVLQTTQPLGSSSMPIVIEDNGKRISMYPGAISSNSSGAMIVPGPRTSGRISNAISSVASGAGSSSRGSAPSVPRQGSIPPMQGVPMFSGSLTGTGHTSFVGSLPGVSRRSNQSKIIAAAVIAFLAGGVGVGALVSSNTQVPTVGAPVLPSNEVVAAPGSTQTAAPAATPAAPAVQSAASAASAAPVVSSTPTASTGLPAAGPLVPGSGPQVQPIGNGSGKVARPGPLPPTIKKDPPPKPPPGAGSSSGVFDDRIEK